MTTNYCDYLVVSPVVARGANDQSKVALLDGAAC